MTLADLQTLVRNVHMGVDVDAGPWTDLRIPEQVSLTEATWSRYVTKLYPKMTKNALATTDLPVGSEDHINWWACKEEEARTAHGWQDPGEPGIQRWWWTEVRQLYKNTDPDVWRNYNDALRGGGYVLATNFLLWAHCVGHHVAEPIITWIKDFNQTRLTRNQYFEGLKPLLAGIKRVVMDPGLRCKVSECHILTGYLLAAPEGFDIEEEARKLAEGGEMSAHGLDPLTWEEEFRSCLREVLSECNGSRGEWTSFRDYVDSREWATSGSSSLGKLEFTVDGKEQKIKARKNLVPYLFTTDELIQRVERNRRKQSNSVVLKKEPGKVRVVVASDLESYLVASWLLKITGHVYTKGLAGGITLDETVAEIVARTYETADTPDTFVLPFDFKSYDHQPTTREVQIMVEEFDQLGESIVPPEGRAEWSGLLKDHVDGFANATLHVHVNNKEQDIRVLGGVMSGWRETSLVGNFWNATMMKAAERVTTRLLGKPLAPIKKYIRGDDSYLTFNSYVDTLLFRVGIAAVGAIGADQKYSINHGEGEFLRVWHARKVASGYVPRAVQGITQRRPWANEPWTVSTDASTAIETARVLERRTWAPAVWQGANVPLNNDIANVAAATWSRKYRQSKHYLNLPRYRGGLGLLDVDHMTPTAPFPADELVLPIATEGSTALDPVITDEFSKFGWKVDVETVRNRRIAQVMTADDVRGYADDVRRKALERARSHKTRWGTRVVIASPELWKDLEMDMDQALRRLAQGRSTRPDLPRADEEKHGMTYARAIDLWREASRQGVEQRSLKQWTQDEFPKTWEIIKEHTTKGWHLSEAVDLALGKIPTFISTKLHPLLRGSAAAVIWNKHLRHKSGRESRHRLMDIANRVSSTIAGRPYQYITSMLW